MSYVTNDYAFLAGGGEMGALVRELDWSASALGPTSGWPQSLRTAVSLCLMSRFPMAVCWGTDYTIVYNDAYRPILGTKHPWAMGRPCFEVWSELAHIVRPMFDGVIGTGEATWSDDLMLPMLRHGYLEEAYFTVSYSAIRGESERPEGVLVTVTETTERYLAERRLRLVRELGDASGSARSVEQASDVAQTILAAHQADVPFSLLYIVDVDGGEARLTAVTGLQPGSVGAPARVPLGDGQPRLWPLRRLLDAADHADHMIVDELSSVGAFPGGMWPEPSESAVLLPIPRPGRREPIAIFVAGVNPRRALDDRHLEFFRLVARQIGNAMANAIAHEEARRRAESLADLDRAKTAFFSNVSHEFRTPLTLMLGPLNDVLSSPERLSEEHRERLDVAHRNSLRLLKLVNSLLDFSRIEAGRIQATYEPTDLAVFTADVASVFRSAIERAGLRFLVNCVPTSDQVFVDRDMWEKIVLNLVSNAFKFTFEGEIEVSLGQVDRIVQLTVRDTGAGIPPDEMPHLFERFHRVRNARGRSFEGTGIGLALVQELVKLHGGTVAVKSEIDRGSMFFVSLPVGSAHLPPDRVGVPRAREAPGPVGNAHVEESAHWLAGDRADAPAATLPREARILVADDNADMRQYVRRLLDERYAVETVGDGWQALEAIRTSPPDLVLADIMMPRLDGLELLAAMRDDPDTRDIPVILLSARAGEDARVEGLRAGADDYLVKPFGANELVARVASIVQLSRLRRQGEERLAFANRELRRHLLEQQTLLDVLPVGIGIATDRECRDIRINRAFAATLGLPADANASKTAPADDRPTNFRVLTPGGVEIPDEQLPMQVAAREGREVNDVEVDIVHNDGRVVRLLEYAAPLFDEQGTPRGAIGAFVDVTASHRARRTLARSEERYRRIFDTAGVSIWEQDFSAVKAALDSLVREGVDDLARYLLAHREFVDHCAGLVRLIDVNSASLRMFGAPDKDALLQSLERVFAPETRTIFAGALVALARGDRRYEAETALRTLDGRSIHALMTMTFPVPGESFESVLVSLADITDRKRIENSLRRNEMLFREMANALQQEVAVRTTLAQVGASLAGELNPDRLVQAVTDAATELTTAEFGAFSYRLRDEKGESHSLHSVSGVLPETVSGFAPFQAADVFGSILRGEAIVRVNDVTQDPRYERYAPVPPGGLPVRSYLAVPVVAHGGQVVGGLFFGHTRPGVFTARHEQLASGVAAWAAIALDNARLYRDVEEANRLKDEFLATLSHELRTPLNAVLGWAQMLRAGIMKPSMQKRALESLERNARVQAQLVEDLLDVSRIISGKLHLKVEAVDIATIIANAVDTVRAGAAAKRLHIEVVFERDRRLLVTGDPDRLQQIVWNLVSNAIKFTPIGGRIDVELRQIDSRAEIVVRDTGQGIAPSFQPFVFERFRQMDGSTARPHGGLGLGLSIVRHLTEAHGGTVSAESAGENRGATFRVRLPLRAVKERDGSAPTRSAGQSPRALAGVRALVVDDEPDARELIRYVLEARGARVWTAASAGEALRLVGRSVFDVLIADIATSEQDEYSLIRVLRGLSTEAQRAIPAIAMTAYPGVHERDEALEAGYTGHLAKPVDPDELVGAVSAAIDGASHRGRPRPKRAARARTQKPKRRRG